jgi:hypothetical protein
MQPPDALIIRGEDGLYVSKRKSFTKTFWLYAEMKIE